MMKRFWVLAGGLVVAWGRLSAAEPMRHGIAATGHPAATAAAVEAMRAGGTAVDGAIAAAVTLAVVDGHNSGLGGGAFWLIRAPDGAISAIDGREMAPAAANRDMYVRDGRVDTKLSQAGPLAVAVPGWVAAMEEASAVGGRLPLERAYRRAADLAAAGFEPDAVYEANLRRTADDLRQFPGAAEVLLGPRSADGRLRQPDLAATLRALADHGSRWFYEGPLAAAVAEWMQANGGVLTRNDFAAYHTVRRDPLRTTYHGHEIIGFPPPSSGGVHVAQILNILESFNLRDLAPEGAEFIHLAASAMTLAFADRAHWLGDPDFAPVPRGLIDKSYAATVAARVDRQRALVVSGHGEPEAATSDVFRKHTTHVSVADADGWWVAVTATINTTFGSKVIVPGTGVILNNEMDDFSAQPGTPNAFGLVGAEANAIAPGKRPLSSMSPTLVLHDGRPVASLGAAGGPTIISQVVLALVRLIDFGQSPGEALAGARVHHQWRPDALRLEPAVPEPVRNTLRDRGHLLQVGGAFGAAQLIVQQPDGEFRGAADPRGLGQADGW